MTREELFKTASAYLTRNGFVLVCTVNKDRRGPAHPLMILAKAGSDQVVVVVMDSTNLRKIPLCGFGKSKDGLAASKAAKDHMLFSGACRVDALWLDPACISHITNVRV